MPYIPELLESSVTVIVRYHEAKLGQQPNPESERIQLLLKKPHIEMITDLTGLIEAAVTASARDEARRPLLMYVLHNIIMLRSVVDSQTPLDDDSLASIKQKLVQYVVDIQTLLLTSQGTEIPIKYNQKEVRLYGLMGRAWSAWKLSCSGNILHNTLFPTLLLPIGASRDRIECELADMLKEYQRHLVLNARELDIHSRETVLKTKEDELVGLKQDVAFLRSELKKALAQQEQAASEGTPRHQDSYRFQESESPPSILSAVWAGLFSTPQQTTGRVEPGIRRATAHAPQQPPERTHFFDWS